MATASAKSLPGAPVSNQLSVDEEMQAFSMKIGASGMKMGLCVEDRPLNRVVGAKPVGNRRSGTSNPQSAIRNPQSKRRGFSLMELLVVISIMGLLAGLAVPAFKQMRKGHAMRAAFRQLQDDLAFARQRAIVGRSTVFVVFLTPDIVDVATKPELNPREKKATPGVSFTGPGLSDADRLLVTNLFAGQYTSYAMYADRRVGDQPGLERPRYLTEWKNLPEGVFIWPDAFLWNIPPRGPDYFTNLVWGVNSEAFPFPSTDSLLKMRLPYIAFGPDGSLKECQNPLCFQIAQGPVGVGKDPNGLPAAAYVDIVEKPPGNHTNNRVVIDWLTGRARVERPEIQ